MNGDDPLLVPPGTRLLHIGPQKTGTTAVQSAFHHHRDVLARHGVHYAGPVAHSSVAVKSLVGNTPPHRRPDPSRRRWRQLLREIHDAGDQRVVLSSESLTDLDDAGIERAVDDVGRERVRVVVTLRPVASILPSQWQQTVQRGSTQDYDAWLSDVFADPPRGAGGALFWRRHQHDRLVERWADVVGLDRVTVVVVDPADRTAVTRAFDRLVGLPEGTLVPQDDRTNRSFSLGETETLREVNRLYAEQGLGDAMFSGIMRYGAITFMKTRAPGDDEPGIATPDWALDRAWELGRTIADRLAESGVRVVGDLDVLRAEPRRRPPADPVVTPEIAARAFMGAVLGTQRYVDHRARQRDDATPADEPTTGELARRLTGRVAQGVTRRVRRRLRRAR